MAVYLYIFIIHLLLIKFRSIKFLILSFILLVIISGIRAVDVGTDTENYLLSFQIIESGGIYVKEPIFNVIARFTILVGGNFTSFLIIYGALTLFPIYLIAFRISRFPMLIIFFYIGLFYYFSGFNIMRQSLSASWIGLGIVYLFIYENRRPREVFKGVLCLLVGIFSHYTSLIILPYLILFFFLRTIKSKDVHLAIIIVAYIIGVVFFNTMTSLGAQIVDYDLNSSNASFLGNSLLVLIQITVFFISFKTIKQNSNVYFLYVAYIIFFCLTIRVPYNSRLVLPFLISNLLFYNNVLTDNRIVKTQKSILYIFFIIYISCYFLTLLSKNFGEIVPYSQVYF